MTNNTMRKLAAAGEVLKADMFRARPQDLVVEKGFNEREENAELAEHIESMCMSILSGMTVPPIEVRVNDEGEMIVVDGHCRRRAYLMAIERGAEIDYVNVLPFKGNDADRVAKMMASSQGKPLSPLGFARGCKRLESFGWDADKIASSTGKTASYIRRLLGLANANSSIHRAVAKDQISASLAMEIVEKNGDKADAVIAQMVEKAASKGNAKATRKDDAGPKMRTRKQIEEALTKAHGEGYTVLQWVLGLSDDFPGPLKECK
jgi:ParB family chromosome partitioning protein